jgi:hypothetical protein
MGPVHGVLRPPDVLFKCPVTAADPRLDPAKIIRTASRGATRGRFPPALTGRLRVPGALPCRIPSMTSTTRSGPRLASAPAHRL